MLKERTQTQQADILAQYLRDDNLHEAKNREGSTLRKILLGLASEWLNFRSKINEVYNEYNPKTTTKMIEEWERFVGIPDNCIPVASTIEQRRLNVLLKLAGISFALTFPFTLTSQQPAILDCLFNKLKPANTQLFFRYSNAL